MHPAPRSADKPPTLFVGERSSAERFALLACGRDADSLDGQKKLRAKKMLEKPHRTHKSSARFVGQFFDLRLAYII